MKKLHETCTFEGCNGKHKARGYCQTHYMMFRRGSEVSEIKCRVRVKPLHCTKEGCTEEVKAKGLCKAHYQRLLRHGHTRYLERKKEPKICVVPNCDNWLYAKGLCHGHYAKNRSWKSFGITVNDYLRMYHEQKGVCKICGKEETVKNGPSGKLKDLSIDHCHKTNVIRGLLCNNCNRAIGLLNDDVNVLKSAIQYLINKA
jgi:hypothetical protein